MMNILSYVKNVKEIKKKDLLATARTTLASLRQVSEVTQLMKANGVSINSNVNWSVPVSIMKHLHKTIPNQVTLENVIDQDCKGFINVINHIQSFIEKEKTNIWSKESLTIKQANAMTLMEQATYWCDYTLLLLDGIVSMQYNQKRDSLTTADMSFLNKTMTYYVDVCLLFVDGWEDVINKFDMLLDGPADEESMEILEEVRGIDAVSPFEKGISIHHFNPIFWIANIGMELDLARLKRMEDDNKYFASKIAQIANRRNGENSPLIDSQIEIYQNKLIKNRAIAARIRSKYN